MRSILVCALVLVGLAGCSLDRQGIGATPGRDGSIEPMDANIPGEDGGVVVAEDASVPAEDGSVPAEDGGVVVGEDATIPIPDAGPPDAGIPCGEMGQSCCDPTDSCDAGLACYDSTCLPCGRVTEMCCAGACSDGSSCMGGRCVASCGGDGQACCGDICNPGLTCERPFAGTPRCEPCGGEGQPCCGGLCNGGSEYYCDVLDDCRRCGGYLTRCCAGETCRMGSCDSDWNVCR